MSIAVAVIGLIFIQASCKNGRIGGSADCPKKKIEELESEVRKPVQENFDFMYAKIGVTVKDQKSKNSFKATVKMRPDSAFSGTVKVAGIMGAAYLIDKDTFAYKNKINKCFKRESYTMLSELFGTDISYNFAQQLILGDAVGNEKIETFYPLKDENFYVLSSHDRKVIERLENLNLEDSEQDDIFIRYSLDCEHLDVAKIRIDVPKDNSSIDINYTKRQEVDGLRLPEETNIKIVTPEDSIFMDLKYNSISLNDRKKINLSIPSSYSECK